MSRLSVLALGLVAVLPACKTAKGVEVEASQLVPKDATLVVGFELKALSESPIGPAIASSMSADPETKGMFDGFQNCEVNLDALHGLIAGSFASETFMAVIESPGLGDEGIVRCLEKELGKATGEGAGLIVFETKGDVRIVPQEGGGHLIILNKNTIVIADAPWDTEVLAAIESPDKRNTDSAMANLIEKAGDGTDVWLAATLGPMERQEFGDVPGAASLDGVLMKVGLGDGVKLDASFAFSEESGAGEFRTAVPAMVAMAKPELPGAGMPADLLDNLEFAGEGNEVTATWSLKADALPGLMATVAAGM